MTDKYEPPFSGAFLGVAFLTIIATVVSFAGTYRESSPNLRVSMVLLVLVIGLDLYLIINGSMFENRKISDPGFLEEMLEEPFNQDYDDGIMIVSATVNQFQKEQRCCGVRDYWSWRNSSAWYRMVQREAASKGITHFNKVPDSCCIRRTPGCGRVDSKGNIFRETGYGADQRRNGCAEKMGPVLAQLYYYRVRLVAVVFVVHVLMILPMAYLDYLIQFFDYEDL